VADVTLEGSFQQTIRYAFTCRLMSGAATSPSPLGGWHHTSAVACPLSEGKRKLLFGAVRAAFDPQPDLGKDL